MAFAPVERHLTLSNNETRDIQMFVPDKPDLQPCLAYFAPVKRWAGVMSLYQIVREITGLEDVDLTEASNAKNTLGWDSLHQIELIFAVECAYHVRFSVAEIIGIKDIGDIRRLLIAKGADVERVDEDRQERLSA